MDGWHNTTIHQSHSQKHDIALAYRSILHIAAIKVYQGRAGDIGSSWLDEMTFGEGTALQAWARGSEKKPTNWVTVSEPRRYAKYILLVGFNCNHSPLGELISDIWR